LTEPLLSVENLKVEYRSASGAVTAIPDLTFHVMPGESYGIVGESGCGKSTLLMAMMRHLGASGHIAGGRILFEGIDVVSCSRADLKRVRGRGISMVYQDPHAALNPTMKVGRQLIEVPMLHDGADAATARQRALKILGDVHLPDPASVMERYPHQLSGGQKQRVVIAMALLANPRLLLLDEPTTGLDVTVEAAVLDLVGELKEKFGTALVYITHNLGVVAKVCERVGVMYLGDLVEEAPVRELFARPRHPYTRRLMACVPHLDADKHTTSFQPIPGQPPSLAARPAGCGFGPRCQGFAPGRCDVAVAEVVTDAGPGAHHRVKCARVAEIAAFEGTAPDAVAAGRPGAATILSAEKLSKRYQLGRPLFSIGGAGRVLVANDGLDLSARQGEILAIVGESGSGKSTFARVLAGLQEASAGKLVVLGDDLATKGTAARSKDQLAAIQMVFQNPDATLNPSHSAGWPIARALRKFGIATRKDEIDRRVDELFDMVRLPRALRMQRPARLSGGQKQRVAIARAFAAEPSILVADEPVSALDVSVQAAIVNLLLSIQKSEGTTIVFISHDLALVRHLADQVAVMYLGRVVEHGPVARLFSPPFHPYTEALISAVPVADPTAQRSRIRLKGDPPSPIDLPVGCRFSGRCPRKVGAVCDSEPPPARDAGAGHVIHCHIPLAELGFPEPRKAAAG
jgi:peptide/nickel transport system ATP-binding protein